MNEPGVLTNTKFKCAKCGGIQDFPSPAKATPCISCGAFDWDQQRIITVCDFCCEPTTELWRFPCRDFKMPEISPDLPVQFSRGDWAACITCKLMAESKNLRGLAKRSAYYATTREPHMRPHRNHLINVNIEIYRLFFAHVTGPPTPDTGDEQ